jgi:hypothetical protein
VSQSIFSRTRVLDSRRLECLDLVEAPKGSGGHEFTHFAADLSLWGGFHLGF